MIDCNLRLFTEAIDVLEIARFAGEANPDVADVSRAGDQRRRAGQAPIVHAWAEADALRDGLDESAVADILWSTTSPELFHAVVTRLKWPPQRYAAWQSDALQRLLFK